MLSEDVLAQLAGIPLNDPAFGPSGVQADGSLICIWADPGADTTGLTTEITRMNRGPALDMLNALAADEGFTCYTPDEGTRCEKEWPNAQYPVTDGRTLYYRDDILIDTRYSNLAPTGLHDEHRRPHLALSRIRPRGGHSRQIARSRFTLTHSRVAGPSGAAR